MVLKETQSGVLKIGGRVWKDQPLSEKETTTGVGKGWAECVEGLRPAETAISASGGRAVF